MHGYGCGRWKDGTAIVKNGPRTTCRLKQTEMAIVMMNPGFRLRDGLAERVGRPFHVAGHGTCGDQPVVARLVGSVALEVDLYAAFQVYPRAFLQRNVAAGCDLRRIGFIPATHLGIARELREVDGNG